LVVYIIALIVVLVIDEMFNV